MAIRISKDLVLPDNAVTQTFAFLARKGAGKRLHVDTPIATPDGWTTMGELKAGDRVFDEQGKPTRVSWVSPIETAPSYRVVFSDGSVLIADPEHLWATWDYASRKRRCEEKKPVDIRRRERPQSRPRIRAEASVRTTEQIKNTLLYRGARNHAVANTQPLQLRYRALPVEPYTFGAWLGDGHSSSGAVTSADPEVIEQIAGGGRDLVHWPSQTVRATNVHNVLELRRELRELQLPTIKHTPPKNFFLNETHELPTTTRSALNRERRAAKQVQGPKPLPGAAQGVPQLKSGAWNMLGVLVAFYPGTMTRHQIARGAKMTPSGGTFKKYWGELTKYGYIVPAGVASQFQASEDAVEVLGATTVMPADFKGRVEYWSHRFKAGAVQMLHQVISNDGVGLTREGLARAVKMEPSGGTFKKYLGELNTNRMIELSDKGRYHVHPWLKGDA